MHPSEERGGLCWPVCPRCEQRYRPRTLCPCAHARPDPLVAATFPALLNPFAFLPDGTFVRLPRGTEFAVPRGWAQEAMAAHWEDPLSFAVWEVRRRRAERARGAQMEMRVGELEAQLAQQLPDVAGGETQQSLQQAQTPVVAPPEVAELGVLDTLAPSNGIVEGRHDAEMGGVGTLTPSNRVVEGGHHLPFAAAVPPDALDPDDLGIEVTTQDLLTMQSDDEDPLGIEYDYSNDAAQ